MKIIIAMVSVLLACASSAVRASEVGLIGHYTFDVDAQDSSSSSNHGMIVGAQIVPGGFFGSAAEFDGEDDYVLVPHIAAMAQPHFTVSAWAKSREPLVSLDRGVFGKHREHDNVSYYWLYQGGDVIQSTMVGQQFGSFQHIAGGSPVVSNEWGLVTLTFDGQTMTLYINGESAGQQSVVGYAGNTYDLLIGAGEWSAFGLGPQRWWNGWIDDVRIYDRALSEGEVLALFTGDTNVVVQQGGVEVTIAPQAALDAGAAWRLNTASPDFWRLSGSSVSNLSAGTYQVVFKPVGGWFPPPLQVVTVAVGQVETVLATYAPVTDDGLVLHFNFDQPPGPVIQDLSGYNNHGQFVHATHTTESHDGWAYEFNGVDNYIQVPHSPSLASTQFTLLAWAKSRDPNAAIDRGIMGKHREHDNISYYWLYQGATNVGGSMVGNQYGNFRHAAAPVDPLLNTWGQIGLTYNGTQMSLYLNGQLVAQNIVTGYRGNTYDLLIGAGEWSAFGNGPQRWWDGWIDDVKVYNRALSDSEMGAAYDGIFNTNPPKGSVTVVLQPAGAPEAGARWRLSSESAETGHESGFVLTDVSVGSYTVEFLPAIGWDAPPSQPVQVLVGQNASVTGKYTYASTNRLVLYFPFDEAVSGPVMDQSGYGNHGYASNVVFDPAGYQNGCFSFNGTNSFVVVPDDDSYDKTQFTLSMWAKTREAQVVTNAIDRGILGKHRAAYNTMYYWVYQHSNEVWGTMIGDQFNDFRHVVGPASPLFDAWGMVTLTYDGTNMCLYMNGAKVDEDTVHGYSGNIYDLLVGAGEWSMTSPMKPQRWWNGWIDEVRIYSYAMNEGEVQSLYSGEASVDVIAPAILDIAPPNRHVTMGAHVSMNIQVVDNVGVSSVTVNDEPAAPIGSDRWLYKSGQLESYSNLFVVVVSDAAGNVTTQEVWYYRGRNISLDALWDGMWEVSNPNDVDVPYTWEVFGLSEAGMRTAPANGTDRFETSVGPKTVRIFVDGQLQDMETWNPRVRIGGGPLSAPAPESAAPATKGLANGWLNGGSSAYGTLSWNSVSSQIYQVYYTMDLIGGPWAVVPGATYLGTGDLMVHTSAVPFASQVYFQVEVSNIATNK